MSISFSPQVIMNSPTSTLESPLYCDLNADSAPFCDSNAGEKSIVRNLLVELVGMKYNQLVGSGSLPAIRDYISLRTQACEKKASEPNVGTSSVFKLFAPAPIKVRSGPELICDLAHKVRFPDMAELVAFVKTAYGEHSILSGKGLNRTVIDNTVTWRVDRMRKFLLGF